MAEHSSIEWTDATWNPITGCSVVSPGCTNCYAMRLAGGRLQHHPSRAGLTQPSKAGPVWNGKVRFNRDMLLDPLRWRRPRKIFVCAHGDLFHESVRDEWIDQVFAVMCLAPWHTFQVLTKRADRMRAYFAETWQPAPAHTYPPFAGLPAIDMPAEKRGDDRWDRINEAVDDVAQLGGKLFDQNRFWDADESLIGRPDWPRRPLPNVWLGVSAEDQPRADERIPPLLQTPAAVHFLSAEPLLGPIDLTKVPNPLFKGALATSLKPASPFRKSYAWAHPLDWVIAGGESGPGARPMHPDWARQIRDDCAAAGVAFHFKQWGAWAARGPAVVEGASADVAWPDGTIGRGTMEANGGLGQGLENVGKKAAGRLLDGVEHNGMPEGR